MYSVNRDVLAFKDTDSLIRHLNTSGRVDLILSETRLPGTNGLDLLAYIKKHMPETHFIALSAVPEDETKAEELGADAFLAKPFVLKDLFDIVEQFVVNPN